MLLVFGQMFQVYLPLLSLPFRIKGQLFIRLHLPSRPLFPVREKVHMGSLRLFALGWTVYIIDNRNHLTDNRRWPLPLGKQFTCGGGKQEEDFLPRLALILIIPVCWVACRFDTSPGGLSSPVLNKFHFRHQFPFWSLNRPAIHQLEMREPSGCTWSLSKAEKAAIHQRLSICDKLAESGHESVRFWYLIGAEAASWDVRWSQIPDPSGFPQEIRPLIIIFFFFWSGYSTQWKWIKERKERENDLSTA